ncbi:hypothetical protein EVAR_36749_1 [Eumeta japonica]|uniref:Mariner Mos1 transposase n=1 Tax=Eumeta variegata TaxID=151549 RepID=A0A4C1X288_EUMVA|nr:hypothetical protein EVAR_36749_1 [Eumeta japonica]
MIERDKDVTYYEIRASLGIGMSQIQSILYKHLGMKKPVLAKFCDRDRGRDALSKRGQRGFNLNTGPKLIKARCARLTAYGRHSVATPHMGCNRHLRFLSTSPARTLPLSSLHYDPAEFVACVCRLFLKYNYVVRYEINATETPTSFHSHKHLVLCAIVPARPKVFVWFCSLQFVFIAKVRQAIKIQAKRAICRWREPLFKVNAAN